MSDQTNAIVPTDASANAVPVVIETPTPSGNAIERVERKAGEKPKRSTRATVRFVRDLNDVQDAATRREIAALKGQLKSAGRNEQKKIRRRLRALNYFGGTREHDSRYYDAAKEKLRLDALNARAKRIAGSNKPDADEPDAE